MQHEITFVLLLKATNDTAEILKWVKQYKYCMSAISYQRMKNQTGGKLDILILTFSLKIGTISV